MLLLTTIRSKDLIDPLGTVLAVFTPVSTPSVGLHLGFKIELSDYQLDAMAELKDRATKNAGTVKKSVPSVQVFSHLDFERSMTGGRNIEAFLQRLPDRFASHGGKLLDNTGAITITIGLHGPRRKVQWSEIVKRAPSYFDTVIGQKGFQKKAVNSRDYGKAVAQRLGCLLPASTGISQPLADVKIFAASVYRNSVAPLEL